MHWEDVASGLGRALGLADLNFGDDRIARVAFSSGLVVDLAGDESGETLLVSGAVGDDVGDVASYRMLLGANLFGQGTGGAALTIDDNEQEILLERRFQLSEFDLPGLAEQLDQFVTFAEAWVAELQTDSTGTNHEDAD